MFINLITTIYWAPTLCQAPAICWRCNSEQDMVYPWDHNLVRRPDMKAQSQSKDGSGEVETQLSTVIS